MSKWELRIVYRDEEEVIMNPSWDQINSVLNKIDGKHLDNVVLISEEAGELMITGGNEINGTRLYHVSYYLDRERYEANLVNPSVPKENSEFIHISIQRVGFEMLKRYLVEYEDMIKAVKHFFETGELTEDQEWES